MIALKLTNVTHTHNNTLDIMIALQLTNLTHTHNKCKKLKQFKTPCKDDMVNSDN